MEAGKKPPHPPAWSRPVRRLVKPFLPPEERKRVLGAIREVESRTTGEVVVHIARRWGRRQGLEAARAKHEELGLHARHHRNAVLILIAHLDHRFAVWGDAGVHEKAGQELWDKAARILGGHFAERRYADGIEACVREVGRRLAELFPKG